ncbi:MAG: hypothetical protein ACPL0C_04370 [Candidatus Bathyarchaeales archaeon]
MKTNIKKILKLATLLATSLLIATASATTYNYLYLQGTVTIGSQKIVWIKTATGEVTGDTVTITLQVESDIPASFNDTLYLKNKDNADHNMTIKVTSAVSSGFSYFYIYIYENFTNPGTWQLVDTLDVKTLNDEYSTYTNNKPLQADSYYKLDFEIKTTSGATFTIKVTYE